MGTPLHIKNLREAKGLNQPQVAEALKVSDMTISNWESGRTEPKASDLRKLSALYGYPMEAMFVGPMVDYIELIFNLNNQTIPQTT